MKMKTVIFLLLIGNFYTVHAQNIQKIVGFADGTDFSAIEIYTDDYLFVLNKEGIISSIANKNLKGNLDYYDNENNEKEKFGKLKSVNDVQIEYWAIFDENDARYGKVKRIGNIDITYWESRNYETEKFGKVKSIGIIPVDYWEKISYEKERAGKIKSVGKLFISCFENSSIKDGKNGKEKNFVPIQFDYWEDSFTNKGKAGKLKSIAGNTDSILVKYQLFYNNPTINYVPY